MTITLGTFLPLLFAGLGIGTLSSLLGVGGGIFIVPLLTLSGWVDTVQAAAGTSLTAITFTSLSASIAYARRHVIQYRVGLTLMPASLLGAWAGARLTTTIESRWLAIGFAVLLLYPIVMMLRGKTTSEIGHAHRDVATGPRLYGIGAAIGLVAGLASGLLGIGSGTIMVPSLALFLGLEILPAIATSLFVMVPSSAFGALTHFTQGSVDLGLALPLIVGTVIGAQFGPFLGDRIPRKRLRQLFGLILLYAAVNMILKALR
ncbi:MAG: sulfite exporter TauE/SafE family protein [Candidatus Bipolaricaulota bacterium]|nr:sulfite exporter TauE/SafE family protein [Candidatus Bipolaricaulota bacterium]